MFSKDKKVSKPEKVVSKPVKKVSKPEDAKDADTKVKMPKDHKELCAYMFLQIRDGAKDQKGAWDHWVEDIEKILKSFKG